MAFFDIEPMGGMNVGGIMVGGALTEEEKRARRMRRDAKKDFMWEQASQGYTPEDAERQWNRQNPSQARARTRLTAAEKIANYTARVSNPNYIPHVYQRKKPLSEYQSAKNDLKRRLFGNKRRRDNSEKMPPETLMEIMEFVRSKGYGDVADAMGMEGGKWYDSLAHIAATALPFIL